MKPAPHQFSEVARLVSIKRFEVPAPGFHDRLRARVMTGIEAERIRAAQPWWNRLFEEFNWQRGMVVANGVAFAGLAFLAVGSFHVAHAVINEEEEGQVYAALPLPAEAANRSAAEPAGALLADIDNDSLPMPSSGLVMPVAATFNGPATSPDDHAAPSFLFTGSPAPAKPLATPRFIFPRSR